MTGLAVLSLEDFSGPAHGNDKAYSHDYERLLDCLGGTRSIEARVTGESSYRPYLPSSTIPSSDNISNALSTTRGETTAPVRRVPAEVVQALARVFERDPSPENQAAVAVLHIVEGQPARAVPLLREAHAQKPDDPRLLNDLAVALLAVSQETGDPWPALEAIEVTQHSLELEPSLPALFNHSIALENLGLRTRAASSWRRYLEQDERSDWAEEAEQRLERLEEEASDPAALAQNLSATREQGERILLTRWAERTLAGQKPEAEAALAKAEALAASLPAGGGRLLAASVATIREAEQAGDRVRRDRMARGHHAYGQALLLRKREQTGAVRVVLDQAIEELRLAGSPFELRARVLRAKLAAEPDWAELRRLKSAAEERGFPSIAAEVLYLTAYRISLEGRLEAAVHVYREARERFDELGEREASALAAVMLAELLEALGEEGESGPELARALAAGHQMADPLNRYSLYVVAASTAFSRFSRAAVELRLEAADACRDLPERPLCAVDSWLWVASFTPDPAFAKNALDQAGELLPAAPDSDGKTRTKIDLAVARASWLAQDGRSTDEWEEAAGLYREAAASYEAGGQAVAAARTRAARAHLLHRLGGPEEASEEYRSGLAAFRLWDQRDRFRPENAERRSPRELREVYEKLIDIELGSDGGEPDPAAFLLSEEMRDRLAPRRSAELWLPGKADLDRLATKVPSGTAIVEYAVLGERAVAWVLADGRLEPMLLKPHGPLGERIRALTGRRHRLDAWKRTSGALFRDLLSPVLERLPAGTERLVVVPDSELYGLPFRALWDPASGRFLDEILTVSLAPSVRQFLGPGESRRGRGGPRPTSSVFSLGFSNFSPSLGLDPLPWAEKEADAVGGLCHGSAAKSCPGSDWAGFRRCASRAGVLHLATHASADSTQSGTWLAFGAETVTLDRLWRELPDLPQRPLVVLSACESVAASGGGEGLGGLARPFLASGARAVVGTLWAIEDRDAAILFQAFHRAYRESGDAAEALRKTREALKDWEERPWAWGAVQVVSAGP